MSDLHYGTKLPAPPAEESKQIFDDNNHDGSHGDVAPVSDEEQRSQFSQVLAGGLGMFADGYQLSTSNVIFKRIYGKTYSSQYSAQIANALLVGIILGETAMGFVTDLVGRKAAVMITSGFLVVGSILGTVAHAPTPHGLFWFLTIARGITGFGSGGEYPAAQTAAVEGADEHYKLKERGFVFLCATIGSLLAGQLSTYIVCLIGLGASKYDNTQHKSQLHKLEIVWRCEWAVGVIFPLLIFAFRMRRMPSSSFRKNAIKRQVPYWLFIKKYWPRLLGSIGSFFVSQFIGYPGGTFSGVIIGNLNHSKTIISTVGWSLLLASFNIPGMLLGAYCTRVVDRRVQLGAGFAGYVILGLVIGLAYEKVSKIIPLFTVLYGIYLSVGAFGPGNLNGLLVSEAYPTSMRGTAHGLIAALGKCGGVAGTFAFTHVSDTLGVKYTFIVGGCLASLGILCAAFLTPNTRVLTLAEIDEDWKAYLEQQGWTGVIGDQ